MHSLGTFEINKKNNIAIAGSITNNLMENLTDESINF